jgi:hypothetical protein
MPGLTAGLSIIKFEQRDWQRCITSPGANPLALLQAGGAPVVVPEVGAAMPADVLVLAPALALGPRAAMNSRWACVAFVTDSS